MKAACVTTIFIGILYSSFDPLPAGEHTVTRQFDIPMECLLQGVPAEDDFAADPSFAAQEASSGESQPVANPAVEVDIKTLAARGEMLTDEQLVKLYILQLQDGARFMDSIDGYSVVFHKEERIGGDLRPAQQLAMKVQHSPNFAVYMKWMNGDKGRQVLYSDAYEDGCLSVKFGGLKRFLPALRIQPDCSSAKAESRYPITQAGIRNLIGKLVRHRQGDLERGDAISCVRTTGLEYDGRECCQFEVIYPKPVADCPYRKHTLLIDAQLHIPLRVKNFTWAEGAQDLAEAELDEMTLIEHYAFSQLNLSRKLAALEFSRDNPKYRM